MNKIQHDTNTGGGSFFIENNNEKTALLTYTMRSENVMVIDHTEVDESLQGQGVGEKLVEAAVNFARKGKINIVPECSYAKHVFEKNESFNDVLK